MIVRPGVSLVRNYTTANNGSSGEDEPSQPSQDPKDLNWLQFLESASKAPWLTQAPPHAEDRLRRAYSLLFQIILYLGRPLSNDVKEVEQATQQFLLVSNALPLFADRFLLKPFLFCFIRYLPLGL